MSWIDEQRNRMKNWAGRTIMTYMDYYSQGQGNRIGDRRASEGASRSYHARWQYYTNRDLYQTIRTALMDGDYPTAKGLHDPIYPVVEFYATHLWPGNLPEALPVIASAASEANEDNLKEAIEQVWEWSNFAQRKQAAARWLAIFGDLFIKVAGRQDEEGNTKSVFMQIIDPRHVWDFQIDERGYITWIRIDVPVRVYENGAEANYVHIEIIDKVAGTMRKWIVPQTKYAPDQLMPDSAPDVDEMLQDAYGIDFVPCVHIPCLDVGAKNGWTPFDAQLDKIDTVNKALHRLGEIMFAHDKPLLAVMSNSVSADGRPMPAPAINNKTDGHTEEEQLGRWTVVRLPGNSQAEWLIPKLDYAGQLAYIDKLLNEIQESLPEYKVERLQQSGAIAAETVELLLSQSEARLIEVRGNAERGLSRAHSIALTIAQNAQLEKFSPQEIGTYEEDQFRHGFRGRRVFVTSGNSKSVITKQLNDASVPAKLAMKMAGWADTYIEEYDGAKTEQDAQTHALLASSLASNVRAFDSGQQDNGQTRPEEGQTEDA